MLKIRKTQKEAFTERAVQSFEDRMMDHLGKLFPAYCETLGDAATRRLVRLGIERAARYRIVAERGVCIYIDAMFAYGRDFDADPSLPWAAEILRSPAIEGPLVRADELFEAGLEHLDEARGIRAEEAV